MNKYVCLIIYSFCALALISCASTIRPGGDDIADKPADHAAGYKYSAWQPDDAVAFDAINGLLEEADMLIKNQQVNAAEDKLERILRIQPDYAPAWSRLSWLALQVSEPGRAVQMAKRSNSFSRSDVKLQTLNWTFIRAASQQLNDDETYQRANQQIEALKAF